jgi:hypothetical protein
MSERLALCETFGLVVLPDAGELAFLDCVNGAADRGEGCPVLAQRRRRLDDLATIVPGPTSYGRRHPTVPHGAHGVVAAPRCTAAENRSSSAPLALSAVMPLHSVAWTFWSGSAASVATAASARTESSGIGVASAAGALARRAAAIAAQHRQHPTRR